MNLVTGRPFPLSERAPEAARVLASEPNGVREEEGKEGRESRFAQVLAQVGDIAATHGFAAVEDLVRVLRQATEEGKAPSKEVLLALEHEHPDRKAFARTVLDRLVRTGKVTRKEDGSYILPKEIFTLPRKSIVQRTSFEHHPLAQRRLDLFLSTFEDVRVLQKNIESEDVLVPVFYQPKTQEEAFSLEKIREAEFRMLPSELFRWVDADRVDDALLITAHERVSLVESMLACALYHPRFGDARRSDEGILEVRYKDGEHRRITGAWFKEMRTLGSFSLPLQQQNALQDSPATFVRTHFSQLFERNLLLPTDFEEKNSQEAKRRVKETIRASPQGVVSFEGIRYSLGAGFKDREVRIQKITPHQAVVFEVFSGSEKPTAFIRLFDRDSLEVKKNAVGPSFVYNAPVAAVDVRAYDEEGRALLTSVSEEEQPDVQKAFIRMKHMADLEQKVRRDGKTSLRSLSREQYDRVLFSDVVDKHRVLVELAVRETGNRGVEILGMLADDEVVLPEAMRNLALLPEAHQADFAQVLHDEVREYRLRTLDVERALQEQNITADQSRDLRFELRSRLLSSFTVLREAKEEGADTSRILRTFQQHNAAFKNFGVLFKEACKGRDGLQLKDLQGVTFEQRGGGFDSLQEEDTLEMLAMFYENWPEQPNDHEYTDARKFFLKSLQQGFEKKGITRWMILTKDGKKIAFLRVQDTEKADELYVGSLNVDRHFKGSNIAEQLVRQLVHEYGKEKDIHAHFIPKLLEGTAYVMRHGFYISGVTVLQDGEDTARIIAITHPKERDLERFIFEKKHEETFSLPEDTDRMLAYIDTQTKKGYVGNAFFCPDSDASKRTIVFSERRERPTETHERD